MPIRHCAAVISLVIFDHFKFVYPKSSLVDLLVKSAPAAVTVSTNESKL